MIFKSFNMLPEQKMSLNNFTLLVHAAKFNLYPAAFMKFEIEKGVSQFLQPNAPAGAPPNIKKSYMRFKVEYLSYLGSWIRSRSYSSLDRT